MLSCQVSCTITFDPSLEGHHLAHALDYFQYQLKGVSFLPRMDYGAFPQVRTRSCVYFFIALSQVRLINPAAVLLDVL